MATFSQPLFSPAQMEQPFLKSELYLVSHEVLKYIIYSNLGTNHLSNHHDVRSQIFVHTKDI